MPTPTRPLRPLFSGGWRLSLDTGLFANRHLIARLARREVIGRYKGSMLGLLWSLLTPLFMLGVYTFVFGSVFKPRWSGGEELPVGMVATNLFAGLIVFQIFAEVVNRAPTLVVAHGSYVKKVVFPLQILVPVTLASALFHAAVSFAVLFVFELAITGSILWTAALAPLALAPFCLMVLGIAWLLASLGVFVRDIGQVVGTLVTALMFLSPVFFSTSALPSWLQPWLVLNPVALPIEQTRAALIFGKAPDAVPLALYTLISIAVAALGFSWFQKTRKGFADVL